MTAEAQPASPEREQGIYTMYAFISSSLSELAPEREALDRGLTAISPHFYDHEHGAAFESHRDEWRHDLTRCHVYIGIYWKKLGPWTLDEFEFAKAQHKPMLLYFKGPFEWEGREEELRAFIAALGDVDRQGAAFFEDAPDDFARLVNADLEREKSKAFAASIERRRQVHAPDTELTYTPTADGGRADPATGAPPPARRRSDVSRIEPFDGEFLDREEVLEELLDALDEDAQDELIELVGPKGMGKGSLLERLVMEDLDQFPDGLGVNPVGASLDDLDDLLRTTFEAFYESSDPDVVTAWSPETLRAHLAGTHEGTERIEALLVFEDVPPESPQFAELRAALPKSLAVCVTSEGESGDGLDVPVEGFDDAADVLALFSARYKAPVPEKAREHVLAACALVGNAPGAIRELGRLASREAKPVAGLEPLVAWARVKAESPPQDVLTRGGAAKDAVKALIAAGGEAPADVVGAVAGPAGTSAALADDIIEPGSPRYRLGGVVTYDVADAGHDDRLMGAILDSAVGWAERANLDEILDDRAFVQRMLDWGLRHGRYEDVLALAESAEPALAMGVRWGAWERVLEAALAAARALNRPCSEAWAKHQLGTRALLLGDLVGARRDLASALELRLAYCAPIAADLTRHNLAVAGQPVTRPAPLAFRIVPGLVAAITALILVGLFGPGGGIDDFDVPFGAVQVGAGQDTLTLFRLGPEEYRNDGAAPLDVVIALDGDPQFCLAIAGLEGTEGECVEPVAGGTAAPRGPPVSLPATGMPLAQGGGDCTLTAVPGEFVLTVPPGAACPVLFGFDPPDEPGMELAATATFASAGGARWRGALSGSTFDVPAVVDVAKTVDADGDGAFAAVEQLAGPGSDAVFEVTVTNARPGSVLTLLELVDNRYGDVTVLAGTDCAVGGPIPPGESYTCRYAGPLPLAARGEISNTVTATVDLTGDPFSAAAAATVLLADPDAAIRVTKLVDADGDGAFAASEEFPGLGAGPVTFVVAVENRSPGDVTIASLRDDAYGDLAGLTVTTCGAGAVVPPGGVYDCRFTADVDPAGGAPHRNTVEVAVDPALDGPYRAQAVVTFRTAVEVAKSVDADGDGEFRPSEPLTATDGQADVPFRVTVRNTGAAAVQVVAVEDSVFGDVTALSETTCATGGAVEPGGEYTCVFRAPIGAEDTHENVVTVTVDTPGGEIAVDSNPVVVPVVLGETVTAELVVDADGDGAFAASEQVQEGAHRIEYEIRVNQPPGTAVNLGDVVVAPFGDVSGLGDCRQGAPAGTCRFAVDRDGDAGDTVEAVLDTEALVGVPGGSTATVRFTDATPVLAVDVSGPAQAAAGERVTISVSVPNLSVPSDPVTLTALTTGGGAALAGLPASTCTLFDIAPERTASCTFGLDVTAAPGATQSITVVARGVDDDGSTAQASGGHTLLVVGADPGPSVEISAAADPPVASPGDTVTFEFVVLNTGGETLSGVAVADTVTGRSGPCGDVSLAPGVVTSCTDDYLVTAADGAAGQVTNTATVTATGPVSDSDSAVVNVVPIVAADPRLVVAVSTSPPSDAPFSFGGAARAVLRDGQRASFRRAPGTYIVELQGIPDLWVLDAVDCGPGGAGDPGAGRATYTLAPGANVVCTFRLAGAPVVDADPEVVNFGTAPAAAKDVEVENAGTAPVMVTPVEDSPHFAITGGDCGRVLPAGDSCTFIVAYTPQDGGAHDAFVRLIRDRPAVGDTQVLVVGKGS